MYVHETATCTCQLIVIQLETQGQEDQNIVGLFLSKTKNEW